MEKYESTGSALDRFSLLRIDKVFTIITFFFNIFSVPRVSKFLARLTKDYRVSYDQVVVKSWLNQFSLVMCVNMSVVLSGNFPPLLHTHTHTRSRNSRFIRVLGVVGIISIFLF